MGEAKGMMPTPSPAPAPAPTPHPQPHRRPRAREVSSRFMTPLLKPSPSSSSTAGDLHHPVPRSPLSKPFVSTSTEFLPRTQIRRSKSAQRQRNQQDSGSDDENRPENHHNISSTDAVRAQSKAALMTKQRLTGRSRADTPMTTMNSIDMTNSTTTRARRGNLMTAATAESAAMKLLQSNGMSGSQFGDGGSRSRGNSREPSPKSSPVKAQDAGSKTRGNSREPSPKSSPVKGHQFDAQLLPDTGGCSGSKVGSSPCCRSLNLEIHSTRPNDKSGNLLLKSCSNPSKSMMMSGSNGSGVCLPPMPPHPGSKMVVGLGGEGKKAMKGEDFHRLRLLNNRFLEWRYANAKAEAAMQAQQKQSEGMLYSLGVKLSELRESVKTKRIELELLQRAKTLSTILEAHMPYLDEWVVLEQDYSTSLGDTIQGLSSVSSQIPIGGNVRCDVKGVEEALISAAKALESTEAQIRNFMPQAELVDNLISQVATVYGGERDLVEECGSLLFKAHLSQVEECSLRGSLMQFHKMKSLSA